MKIMKHKKTWNIMRENETEGKDEKSWKNVT